MSSKIWRRNHGKIQESGLLFAILLAFRGVVPDRVLGFNIFGIYVWDLGAFNDSDETPEGIRWAEASEADALIPIAPIPHDVKPRFDKGMRLAVKEHDGIVVGWSWYDLGHHEEFGWMQYRVGPNDVWGFGAYIAHAHRGEGIFPALRSFACSELKRDGWERVISQVEVLNRASTKACLRTGARRIFRFGYIRVFGLIVLIGEGRIRAGFGAPVNGSRSPYRNGSGGRNLTRSRASAGRRKVEEFLLSQPREFYNECGGKVEAVLVADRKRTGSRQSPGR